MNQGRGKSTFLNSAGGAWDNAKKYIETGSLAVTK